jgi:hypothetical protein
VDPVGHHRLEAERRRDREALKIVDLARAVGRDEGDGRVEAGEPGEAAGDAERQEEDVDRRPEAEREGAESGSDAERDLYEAVRGG